jgi:hypothetical protein
VLLLAARLIAVPYLVVLLPAVVDARGSVWNQTLGPSGQVPTTITGPGRKKRIVQAGRRSPSSTREPPAAYAAVGGRRRWGGAAVKVPSG